ncbi:hypothetical protein [Kitasatospora sp. NPDC059599]|uniref:hypothetical protein n=1 Tax=Kitasatospora sp. NPDC059599 TaxID=3346880 RepID=UPI003678F578
MKKRIEDEGRYGGTGWATGPVGRWLAHGLLVALGLAVTALCFRWYVDTDREVNAHLTAPTCGTAAAAPGADCLRHESGKVRSKNARESNDSTIWELTVSRESAATATYSVGEAFYHDVAVGTDVQLALWRGRVAEVSYHGHSAENRSRPWLAFLGVALPAGLGSALTACGLARPRRNAVAASAVASATASIWTAVFAFFGASALLSGPVPFVIAVGVPALGWLAMTAVATVYTAAAAD